jgi:hypothetical protein
MERKRIKDTKIGKFLMDKAPKVLDIVGDILPTNGALGIIKNLIKSDDDIPEEDKVLISDELVKIFALEIEDRDSARKREVGIAQANKYDFLFHLTGIIGLATFCFIVYAIVYLSIPEHNKDMWTHLIGIVEGVVLSIFGYYFGSSIKKND